MARNKYGLLTIIASKEAREKWAINHKDLLELDGRELVIQTGLNQELVLTEEGRLYEKRGDPAVYTNVSNIENTLIALTNVVSIHLNNAHTGNEWIIELADGSFYKFDCATRRWAKYEFNPPMRSAQFSNEFVVEFEEREAAMAIVEHLLPSSAQMANLPGPGASTNMVGFVVNMVALSLSTPAFRL
jgi:hypothetical protein